MADQFITSIYPEAVIRVLRNTSKCKYSLDEV